MNRKTNSIQKGKTVQVLTLLYFAFFLCAAKGGCKKNAVQNSTFEPATIERKADFLKKKTISNFPKKIKSYESKAIVRFESESQNMSATASLVWVKDKFLWVAVKKFGFEVVRAKLTPDSVFVINRIQNTYMERSMEWLEREYNVPGGFELVSHLLLGQAYFPADIQFESSIKDSLYVLNGKSGPYSIDYKLSGGNYFVQSMLFAQAQASRFMGISFLEREVLDKFVLPNHIQTEAFSQETNRVTFGLKMKDIQVNTKREVRFSVPKHYKRI